MDNSQAKIFGDELTAIFSIYDKPAPSKIVKTVWWKILLNYDLNSVLKALEYHAGSNKFFPKPADIVEILTKQDGRPTADEAWSVALKGRDEVSSVVWTDEISQAFLSVALPILESGDKIGARIGFRDNYNRLVEQARAGGVQVHWSISCGTDKQLRSDTAQQAVVDGYLSHDVADRFLIEDMSEGGKAIAGLIGYDNKSKETPPEDIKDHIEKLRKDIKDLADLSRKKEWAEKKLIDDEMQARREFLSKQAENKTN